MIATVIPKSMEKSNQTRRDVLFNLGMTRKTPHPSTCSRISFKKKPPLNPDLSTSHGVRRSLCGDPQRPAHRGPGHPCLRAAACARSARCCAPACSSGGRGCHGWAGGWLQAKGAAQEPCRGAA